MDTFDLMALAWAGKLAAALIAVFAAFWVLRWWDRRAGIQFRAFADTMNRAPAAAAVYLGFRVLAVCMLVGLVMAFG